MSFCLLFCHFLNGSPTIAHFLSVCNKQNLLFRLLFCAICQGSFQKQGRCRKLWQYIRRLFVLLKLLLPNATFQVRLFRRCTNLKRQPAGHLQTMLLKNLSFCQNRFCFVADILYIRRYMAGCIWQKSRCCLLQIFLPC